MGQTRNNEHRPQAGRHVCLSLFAAFFKIGAFTFGGGYAMIPLIEREIIERRKWIAQKDFMELLTLAQSAPGPIATNAAVFVGYRTAGLKGAVSAATGAVLPSFIIILLIALYLTGFRDNRYVDAAFKGIRPAVVALIAAPLFNLAHGLKWWKLSVAVATALVVWLLGVSPVWFIMAGALAGIAYAFCQSRGMIGPDDSKHEEKEDDL